MTTIASLENLYAEKSGRDRQKAWERLQTIGLPTRKSEAFRYVRLNSVLAKERGLGSASQVEEKIIEQALFPEADRSYLVFVNGHYTPQLSDRSAFTDRAVVSSYQEAFNTYRSILQKQWAEEIENEEDPFSLINASLHSDSAFIYLPPRTLCEKPLQIINIITDEQFALPRTNLFVGKESEVHVINTTYTLSDNYAVLGSLSLQIEEGAKVDLDQVHLNEKETGWHFEAVKAVLKRDSRLDCVNLTQGSLATRYSYKVSLLGENGEASLSGLAPVKGSREAHNHVLIEHHAPHCRSNQKFKNILDEEGHTSFEGKIYVHRPAQKTEAYQLNQNLLLDDRAQAESKPNLEIFADDVSASHGATFGQLDREQVHYFETRGLPKKEAERLIVFGYCEEILQLLKIDSLRDYARDKICHG